MQNVKNERLEIIEILRMFAALAVTWFHYTNGNSEFLDDGWLKLSGKYGWLGVEIFFVLSGFIIPYSMWRSNFRFRCDWHKFLIKRTIRIYPAYLTSILVIILFAYISTLAPNSEAINPQLNPWNLSLHIGLLNGIVKQPWLNSAFWTLGIEFQYYLLIVFIYPLLISTKLKFQIFLLLIICTLPFVFPQDNLVFSWLHLFGFGMLALRLTTKKITLVRYSIVMLLLGVICSFSKELLVVSVGFITSLAIAFIQFPKIIIFSYLGELSYSLYLLHSPVGGKVIYFASLIGEGFKIEFLSLILALIVSIFSAYLMYKYIEKPAQNYAKFIKYNVS